LFVLGKAWLIFRVFTNCMAVQWKFSANFCQCNGVDIETVLTATVQWMW